MRSRQRRVAFSAAWAALQPRIGAGYTLYRTRARPIRASGSERSAPVSKAVASCEKEEAVQRFVRVQFLAVALSIIVPAGFYACVIAGVVDPLLASNVAVSVQVICWFFVVVAPFLFGGNAPQEVRLAALIVFWGFVTFWAPVMWDLTWVFVHPLVDGSTAEDRWLWYWWMYAVADTRFLNSDPLMLMLETWSGILGFAHLYALTRFCKGEVRRAFYVAASASMVQFYGTTAFFGVEILLGFRNISPDFFSFYVKWWGMNGFWIVMPFVTTAAYLRLLALEDFDAPAVLRRHILGR